MSTKSNLEKLCNDHGVEYSEDSIETMLSEVRCSIPTAPNGSIENRIEKLFFEKTYWKYMLKKVAGELFLKFALEV